MIYHNAGEWPVNWVFDVLELMPSLGGVLGEEVKEKPELASFFLRTLLPLG